MPSLSRTFLIGHLGDNPELKHFPDGSPYCVFTVATNEEWTDKSGQKKTQVDWHKVVVKNRQAEACATYLQKGRLVSIEGKNRTRSWNDKDGVKRYTTEVIANQVLFLGGKEGPAVELPQASLEQTSLPSDDDVPF